MSAPVCSFCCRRRPGNNLQQKVYERVSNHYFSLQFCTGLHSDYEMRVVSVVLGSGEIRTLEDGYYRYMPHDNKGALSADDLRIIAQLLDNMNDAYHAQVCADLTRMNHPTKNTDDDCPSF